MNVDDMFTDKEKAGVELHFNVKWENLKTLAKLSYGFTYREELTPEAISNRLLYGNTKGKVE